MQPGPRTRTRRRRAQETVIEASEPIVILQEDAPPPEQQAEAEAVPTVIDTTGVALDDEGKPLTPHTDGYFPPQAKSVQPFDGDAPRTDFYFPPLPTSGHMAKHEAVSAPSRRSAPQWPPLGETIKPLLRRVWRFALTCVRGLLALLMALARGARWLARGGVKQLKLHVLPRLRAGWHWIVDDPNAPPRESRQQALLQGRVLGVYRYYLYQRILVGIFGVVPLVACGLYILYTLVNLIVRGTDDWLFVIQDFGGALTGLFGSLILLSLVSTRITLHSDGIEYKTMFRVVRSRWEEIGALKVEYFRKNERWVVGTGRGAWAFLYRSLLGLPKGRQLAKLITIYARLNATGTPYWLPAVGRYKESVIVGEVHVREEKPARTRKTASAT